MGATEERLLNLETKVDEVAADLRVLRGLVAQDHASALNKIRYVTEKVLHGLCAKSATSWGKQEPTLENMIGPLIAAKVVPKNVAVHIRTVQTNASPGSHFQEDALSGTHVQVAQMALLEVLEWYYGEVEPPASLESPRAASPSRSRRRLAIAGVVLVAAAAVVGLGYGLLQHGAAPPAIREPIAGLDAVQRYEHPVADNAALGSEPMWQAAADDFAEAAKQPGAPAHLVAAEHFARGVLSLIRGDLGVAEAQLRVAIAVEPTWAAPHAALASALAYQNRFDQALASAREAQRLAPQAWPWLAAGARVDMVANRLDDAIAEYRRALLLAPKEPILLAELALVYHAAGFDTEAAQSARDALALAPDMIAPRILLAERALEAGDAATAMAEASHVLALSPYSIAALLALADAKELAGDHDAARELYRKAVDEWHSHKSKGAPEARLAEVERLLAAPVGASATQPVAKPEPRQRSRGTGERLKAVRISAACQANPLGPGCN